jgi:hypothetical protein
MALPRIVVRGKEIILLGGFKDEAKETSKSVCAVVVDDEVKLQQAAKSAILTQLPSAMWRANGSPLLKPPCDVATSPLAREDR